MMSALKDEEAVDRQREMSFPVGESYFLEITWARLKLAGSKNMERERGSVRSTV